MGKINTLDPVVAARIAAGEVIDRPQSLARELIDNALDAHATEITLSVEGGGIDRLRVIDNGSGIEKEDLPLTIKRHATSKISTIDDLYHLSSMGFRGEALYSISSVSKLTIASACNGEDAWTFSIDNGEGETLKKGGPDQGTTVTVEGLFEAIPARRSFLKRAQAEATLCRNTLLQKAMAFPEIHFRYRQDGALKIDLPAQKRLFDRVLDILTLDEKLPRAAFCFLEKTYDEFSIKLVTSLPEAHRSDRSKIKVYINNRPVEEYSLVQAISYGYGEKLPGGAFPYSVLFVEDNSELVDFNIHPAKKEVKLRNKADIHHAITTLISQGLATSIPTIKAKEETPDLEPIAKVSVSYKDRDLLYNKDVYKSELKDSGTSAIAEKAYYKKEDNKPKDNSWLEKAKELTSHTVKHEAKKDLWQEEEEGFIYIGQAFSLFLIAEKSGRLYFVDQHAAHERIIFNELREQKSVQPLLTSVEFEVEPDVDKFLCAHAELYTQYGIMISRKEDKLWELTSLPAMARPVEDQLIEYISTKTGSEEELESGLYAIVACRAAIKAGDKIDRYSAEALLEKVFALEDPACPHGRTFVAVLDEAELRKMVGRTK